MQSALTTPIQIIDTDTNRLSFYRTRHTFLHYCEFTTLKEFQQYLVWARHHKKQIYILGNGSNTLFKGREIQSLILKNRLSPEIKPISQNRLEVSSSTLLKEVLTYCQARSWSCFYYLASVPATIGGALAMNAGRGRQHNQSIYDFVETVTFFEIASGQIMTLTKEAIVTGYRETIFTDGQPYLILKAVFKFETTLLQGNAISERLRHAKRFQDNSAPNCGSVFKQADTRILKRLQGLTLGETSFSGKTINWILNKSDDSRGILILIGVAKLIHFLLRKTAKLEVIIVK